MNENIETPTPPQLPVPPPPAGGEPLFWGMKLNIFCMMMYLSILIGKVIPIPGADILLPIVLWLANKKKDDSGIIRRHGKNILNFIISILIYAIIFIAPFIYIPLFTEFDFFSFHYKLLFYACILLALALGIWAWTVLIIAAVKAGNSKVWPMPLCIRFFKTEPKKDF